MPRSSKIAILPSVISAIYGFTFMTLTRMLSRTADPFSLSLSDSGFCCFCILSSASFRSSSIRDWLSTEPVSPFLVALPLLSPAVRLSDTPSCDKVPAVSASPCFLSPVMTFIPQYSDPCSPFPIATPAAIGRTERRTLNIPVIRILLK